MAHGVPYALAPQETQPGGRALPLRLFLRLTSLTSAVGNANRTLIMRISASFASSHRYGCKLQQCTQTARDQALALWSRLAPAGAGLVYLSVNLRVGLRPALRASFLCKKVLFRAGMRWSDGMGANSRGAFLLLIWCFGQMEQFFLLK